MSDVAKGPRGSVAEGAGRLRRWRVPGAVAALVVVQLLLLRSLVHPAPHPGGDNAAYVSLAWSLVSGQGYSELWDPSRAPHAKYPPVYPALLAARMALGGDTWQELKGVTVLLTLVGVLAVWLWAAGRKGPTIALGVALLTGLSTSVLDYGRWVLSDVPFLALTFLGLWAVERAMRRSGAGDSPSGVPTSDADGAPGAPTTWWLVGLAATAAAYFTRSAGLPLLLVALGFLARERRWRVLALGGGAVAALALAWLVRGLGGPPDPTGYGSAFWAVDPYRPELGSIGAAGLVARIAANIGGYLTGHLPQGLVGTAAGPARALAVAVVLLGVVGWTRSVRRRLGPTEVFVPLYLGLILVWPEVWSGDRFALPLLPPVLLYAAGALEAGLKRVAPVAAAGGLLAALALVALPQMGAWGRLSSESAACRGAARVAGPWACWGAGVAEFAGAARWADANLPDDGAVLTRKPRIWYVMSGLPSRTYPFVADPDALLTAASEAGARWVVLDRVGAQGARYLAPAVVARARRFCAVASFGGGQGGARTELLGILEPEEAGAGTTPGATEARIGVCEGPLAGGDAPTPDYSASSPIPILAPSPP